MKKLFTLLTICVALASGFQASAQYCGRANAVAGLPPSYNGFGPLDNIPCAVQGQQAAITIPFKNYTQFTAQGNHVTIKKMRIDTIQNLPCGLCWSTNKPTNEFLAGESGAFLIQGLTNDPPGEYKAYLIIGVATQDTNHYDIPAINADAGNVYLYIRVQANGTACASVDTSRLGLTAGCTTDTAIALHVGIHEIGNAVSALAIQPNPMANDARVTFTSEVAGNQQVRIINIVGSEVYNTTINANAGMNETTIHKGNLPAGIYILSVGNAKGTSTKKFVISE